MPYASTFRERAAELVRGGEASDFYEACRILGKRAAKTRRSRQSSRRSPSVPSRESRAEQAAREARALEIEHRRHPTCYDV